MARNILSARLVDRQTGQPIRSLERRAEDGRLLGPDDCRRLAAEEA